VLSLICMGLFQITCDGVAIFACYPSEISNPRFGSSEKPDFDPLSQRKRHSDGTDLFSSDCLSRRKSAKLRLNAANYSIIIDRL
jgi:hypothetical protein